MKLIVITGQEGADADGLLRQVIADNGYSYSEAPRMVFPERSNLLYHPRSLYNNVRKVVRDHIDNDEDLFVVTFSDYTMYGVRAEIRQAGFEGAMLYQAESGGGFVISEIDSNGKCIY